MSESIPGVSLRELLVFFYKYRLRLFMAFLLPALLFIAISFIPTPRYDATASMIVRLGSEYVYQPEISDSASGSATTIPFDQEQIFKAEVAILSSDDLHEEVIKALGVEALYPRLVHPTGLGALIGDVEGAITGRLVDAGILPPPETLTPEQAEKKLLARATLIFDKRLDILLEKESAVIDISFQHPDADMAVKALDTLLALYFEKRRTLYLDPRADMVETQVDAAHERMLAASGALEDFKRKYRIYSLDDQRTTLLLQRSALQKQATTVISQALDKRIGGYNAQLDQLDAEEREFDNLQREAQIANDAYALATHKLDEARSYENLQRQRLSSVRVIQQPMTPPEPKKLQMLIIIGGLFLSLINMFFIAALTEFGKTGFLTPERLSGNIGLPVLAAVPYRRQFRV